MARNAKLQTLSQKYIGTILVAKRFVKEKIIKGS